MGLTTRWSLIRRTCMVGLLTTAALAPSAHAAFPGANGRIAYSVYYPDPTLTYQMCTAGQAGGNVRCFASSPDDPFLAARDPAWSPDGTKVAYSQAGFIFWNNDVSGGFPVGGIEGLDGDAAAPAWSPDGARMAFERLTPGGANEIWVARTDNSVPHSRLTTVSTEDRFPAWSPDGTRIAFASNRDGNYEIYVMNTDGSGQTRLTNSPAHEVHPEWSPDGAWIVFSSASIYKMHPDGTGLTFVAGGTRPSWSPDGSRIAFANDSPFGGLDFYTVSPDGSGEAFMFGSQQFEREIQSGPDWQPIPVKYARPKGATPFLAPLVIAYEGCAAPNRVHGPPLAHDSCAPPAQASQHLTVGTADANSLTTQFVGHVHYKTVIPGFGTPAYDADVRIAVSATDIRLRSDLNDYAGELLLDPVLRITDKDNSPSPPPNGPGTVIDASFPVTVPCAPTSNPDRGADCSITTTADSLVPNSAKELEHAIWELGQVRVYDGGADGDADTRGDNTLFLTQGLFIP